MYWRKPINNFLVPDFGLFNVFLDAQNSNEIDQW